MWSSFWTFIAFENQDLIMGLRTTTSIIHKLLTRSNPWFNPTAKNQLWV